MERERADLDRIRGEEASAPATAATSGAAPTAATSSEAATGTGSGSRPLAAEPAGETGAAGAAAAAGSETAEGSGVTPAMALAMRAYRNARYHEDRQAWFDGLSKWSNFATILLGSGTVLSVLGTEHTTAAVVTGLLTTVVGAAQLVFDFGVQARVHGDLKKGFALIAADAAEPHADAAALNAKMARLYADEPETYHAVNALAFNAAQKAFDRPDSTLIDVKPRFVTFRHWRRFDPSDFPDRSVSA